MFCAHCGKEIPDGTIFCPVCGQNTEDLSKGGTGEAKKLSKAGSRRSFLPKLKILIPILAVLVVALVVVLSAPYIVNTFKKLTSSPEDYCKYVLKKNYVDSGITREVYANLLYDRLQMFDDSSFSGELGIMLSEDAQDMLEDGLRVDGMEALSNIKVAYDQQRKGNRVAWGLTFSSGKKSFLTTKLIYDSDEENLYVNIPEINPQYAKVELGEILSEDELDHLEVVLNSSEGIVRAFPDPKTAERILNRYLNIVIAGIDNVKEKNEELKIEGVRQSVTTLTIKIDEDMVRDIVETLCEEAANDDELEDVFVNIADAAIDLSSMSGSAYPAGYYLRRVVPEDGSDLWEEFEAMLDKTANEMDDLDFFGDKYELKLYVSGAGKIQGAEFHTESRSGAEGILSSVYAVKGMKLGYEAAFERKNSRVNEKIELSGEGRITGGKISADFELSGTDMGQKVKFSVDKLSLAGLVKGKLSGELSMELKQFKDELKNTPVSDLADQTAVIRIAADKNSNTIDFILREDKDEFAKLSVGGKMGKAVIINTPADSKCDEIDDVDSLGDYLDDCDFDDLADTMEDLDMPDELVDWVEDGALFSQFTKYVEKSKISSDMQLADSIHTAVLTAMMDPAIYNDRASNEMLEDMEYGVDITQYTGNECAMLKEVADILGVNDLHELSGKIKSKGATGCIMVYVDTYYSTVRVVLEGTDSSAGSGYGGEITAY